MPYEEKNPGMIEAPWIIPAAGKYLDRLASMYGLTVSALTPKQNTEEPISEKFEATA